MILFDEEHLSNLFERIACLQTTSGYSCGEGLNHTRGQISITITGFVSSVGFDLLSHEADGIWYDDSIGLRVY